MGGNLALNAAEKGYKVAVYNRTAQRTKELVEGPGREFGVKGLYSIDEFVRALGQPRLILLMVTAGPAVDAMIEQLTPRLSKGDVIADGGNSLFRDTESRMNRLSEAGINYLGVGISGGEDGARHGPCIMPGGPQEAYEVAELIFKKVSAKTELGDCVTYLGARGAGHFTKMVHNGIEYAIMQILAEAYDLMSRGLKLKIGAIQEVFQRWSKGRLESYLVEIASNVMARIDEDTGKPLVELILDKAGQKGTGKWTSQVALDLGVPIPSIDSAVAARSLSSFKELRSRSALLAGRSSSVSGHLQFSVEDLEDAVSGSILTSYIQGMNLLRTGSDEYAYGIDLAEVLRIWRGGCIIRARVLDFMRSVYLKSSRIESLLLDAGVQGELAKYSPGWRRCLRDAKIAAIPTPAMDASLNYFESFVTERLPANIIQAMRDYFGAHTYERTDKAGSFHTRW
jgi:6-phosphogluconate dehydrogenase